MIGSKIAAFVVAAACALPAAARAQEAPLPPARQVVERWVQAIGGRDAALRVRSVRSRATLRDDASGGTMEAEYLNLAPDRSLMRLTFADGTVVTSGYNGRVGWEVTPGGARLLSGNELRDLAEESVLHRFLYDSTLLREAETTGVRQVEGAPCHHVRFVWLSGRETGACFSVATGLRVAVYRRDLAEMGRVDAVEVHDDYRPVDSLLNPMRVRYRARGTEITITFTRVEQNVALAPSLFDPPPGAR
jgi:hypothetical protein